ncbi:MAG: SLBB domain-containing protein [Defluviitaleaceae bacterium]|nr:SLBB domain-containing protein [Defluviitaleaceae bacterium]
MGIDEIKKIIRDCGIVGVGGDGFPTHLKMDSQVHTILLNCAECEPLLKVHQRLLACYPNEILSALGKLSDILDASVVIAIKKNYKAAISAVSFKLEPRMKLALLDDIYPVGDEIVLIYEALGTVIQPGTLPIESGCMVLNVETAYNIYNALEQGLPVTQKWVTIIGEVENPSIVLIPLGTTIEEAVKQAGNITVENPAFITGGPMMGGRAFPSDEIKKTTNAVLVLPNDHMLAQKSMKKVNNADINRIASACCQCRTCTDMCPRYLLGYPIEPHKIMQASCSRYYSSEAFHGIMYCSLCGLCEMIACPQSLSPRSLNKIIKTSLIENGIKPKKLEAALVSDARKYRYVNTNRLVMRLGLAKYEV